MSEAEGWPQFCEVLSRYSGDGRTSLRDLEKIATRKGLSLPRSTLSRHLQGDKLPRRLIVQNYLLALEMDISDSGEVLKAWDRIADLKAHNDREQNSGVDVDQASDEIVYDFARNLLDVVRAAIKKVVVEAKNEIDSYGSQARDQQKEAHDEARELLAEAREHLDTARKDGEKIAANAKRDAAKILADARLEAQRMTANTVLRVPLDSPPTIGPISTSLSKSGLNLTGSVSDTSSTRSSVLNIDTTSTAPKTGEQQKSAPQKQSGQTREENSSKDSKTDNAGSQTQAPNGELHLKVGDQVHHDKYGLGTVIELTGEGARATVRIDFGSTGIVKLMLISGIPLRKV